MNGSWFNFLLRDCENTLYGQEHVKFTVGHISLPFYTVYYEESFGGKGPTKARSLQI